jgi:hypothetical protein
MDKELLFMNEWRKFLEMELTLGEDVVNIVEITAKYLQYHINLDDKAIVVFERIDFSIERSLWMKCYPTELHATEKIMHEDKGKLMGTLHLVLF